MFAAKSLSLFGIPALFLIAGSPTWKDKPIPDWTDDDTHLVLNDSPWAKAVQPAVDQTSSGGQRPSRGMGRGGGINLGGIGIGIPGMGGGRRGGGYPGGGSPGGGYPGGRTSRGPADNGQPPTLRIRWESAMPVRAAEMKSHDPNAPASDQDQDHYAIAVYGVPERFLQGTSQSLAGQLKKQAVIKRDGKANFKPSSVEVVQRDSGAVILYLFSRSKEITRQDKRIEFDAKIGRLHFAQGFYVDDMVFQGKLEL